MARVCYTRKLLKLTINKQEANTMLNVFMNVTCRFIAIHNDVQL